MAQNGTAAKKPGKRLAAAAYRVAGLSQEKAAEQAGIGRRTLIRWEGVPGDADYWRCWEEATQQLKKTVYPEAFLTLRQGLRAEREGDRIRAAEILIKLVDGDTMRIEADVNLTGGVAIYVPEREDDDG